MNFGVMFETEDGKIFKTYKTLEEAQNAATNATCGMGWLSTIFDYDMQSNSYIEFYAI